MGTLEDNTIFKEKNVAYPKNSNRVQPKFVKSCLFHILQNHLSAYMFISRVHAGADGGHHSTLRSARPTLDWRPETSQTPPAHSSFPLSPTFFHSPALLDQNTNRLSCLTLFNQCLSGSSVKPGLFKMEQPSFDLYPTFPPLSLCLLFLLTSIYHMQIVFP